MELTELAGSVCVCVRECEVNSGVNYYRYIRICVLQVRAFMSVSV